MDLVKAQRILLDAGFYDIQMVDGTGNMFPSVDDGYPWAICSQSLRPGTVVHLFADDVPKLVILVEHTGAVC